MGKGNPNKKSANGVPWMPIAVHLFTALGVVTALLATMAVFAGRWEEAFAWLGVALVIDTLDGPMARSARVASRLPRFSGERLDLIIDYLTYVFIPVLMLLQAGLLTGILGTMFASAILVSSLYHCSDMNSKSSDNCFVGFPAVWNVVVFYIFAFGTSGAWIYWIIGICVVLTFVPFKWVHPVRVVGLRSLTLALAGLWLAAAAQVLLTGFTVTGATVWSATGWPMIALGGVAIYGIVLSLSKGLAQT